LPGSEYDVESNCSSKSKGGVGKTTTAVNLSSCLAYKGKKVLIWILTLRGTQPAALGLTKRNQ